MKFFLDTAEIAEIKALADTGLVDGVTTNPTLIAKSGRKILDVICEICDLIPGPVSAEVAATDFDTMLAEGRKLAGLRPNVAVKVPLTADGLKVCKALSDEGRLVNVTLCFSANQAILAAKAGAAFISPFVGRLDDIGEHIGQGPVVPDRPGQHEWHLPADAFVHDPAGHIARFHRGRNGSMPADLVDNPQVVGVPTLDGRPLAYRNPERGAENVGLQVMGGEAVAGEEHVHPALPDQSRHVGRGPRVHHCRTAYRQHPAPGRLALPDAPGHLGNKNRFRLLRGNFRPHELEGHGTPGSRWRLHANPRMSKYDPISSADLVHGHRPHPITRKDDHTAVHLRVLHLSPLACYPDPGGQIGG